MRNPRSPSREGPPETPREETTQTQAPLTPAMEPPGKQPLRESPEEPPPRLGCQGSSQQACSLRWPPEPQLSVPVLTCLLRDAPGAALNCQWRESTLRSPAATPRPTAGAGPPPRTPWPPASAPAHGLGAAPDHQGTGWPAGRSRCWVRAGSLKPPRGKQGFPQQGAVYPEPPRERPQCGWPCPVGEGCLEELGDKLANWGLLLK